MTSIHYVHKDENHAIIIARDGSNKLQVHLVSYVSRMLPNFEGILEEHLSPVVMSAHCILVRLNTGEINKSFKAELSMAINKCQEELVKLQQNEEYIEGALRDYVKVE